LRSVRVFSAFLTLACVSIMSALATPASAAAFTLAEAVSQTIPTSGITFSVLPVTDTSGEIFVSGSPFDVNAHDIFLFQLRLDGSALITEVGIRSEPPDFHVSIARGYFLDPYLSPTQINGGTVASEDVYFLQSGNGSLTSNNPLSNRIILAYTPDSLSLDDTFRFTATNPPRTLNFNLTGVRISAIPEPATGFLLGGGLLTLALGRATLSSRSRAVGDNNGLEGQRGRVESRRFVGRGSPESRGCRAMDSRL